ncbi:MAG TPA: VWA domain-containing protein [Candidatus Acetothermia bacterium]|nr:VWA domain-containing protein [Candidatus Acetothermia bacterium]
MCSVRERPPHPRQEVRVRTQRLAAALFACVLFSVVAVGDGIIVPHPGPEIPGPPVQWLTILYHHVTVSIDEGIAITKVDQAFRNETGATIEGTYLFPLPSGAVLQAFSLWIEGEEVAGKILPADEARDIYLSYVRQSRDPALLEYVGRGAFQAHVYPIEPGETRQISLEYAELLSPDLGWFRYQYPLAPERFSARPLEQVRVEVSVSSARAVGAVYSPSHEVSVTRDGASDAHAVYAERNVLPDRDFLLYYSLAGEAVGADLLTHTTEREDGWFLLLLSPPAERELAPLPKDVILVIDRSGSMGWNGGDKMVQAKSAATFILNQLGAEDRFGVIAFESTVTDITPGLVPATPDAVVPARDQIAGLVASGGTNLHAALLRAMSWLPTEDRPHYVLFLTDGEATAGVVDTDQIVRDVTAGNQVRARLFTFGVGYDVNAHLLDLLAEQNQGTTTYVKPDENLEAALTSFYRKIAEPALSNLSLRVEGIATFDLYPTQLPDLFYGSQIAVFGRYAGDGAATIVLSGRRESEDVSYVYPVVFADEGSSVPFLPRLWAARKIGHLLNIIRFEGETEEIKNQIVELAMRYGIATPYTSFLVEEEERATVAPPSSQLRLFTGQQAVEAAQATQSLADAETSQRAGFVREIGDRVFLFVDEGWTESTYPTGDPTVDLVYLSEDYFEILEENPEVGAILALGDAVVFRLGEAWVRVVVEGAK